MVRVPEIARADPLPGESPCVCDERTGAVCLLHYADPDRRGQVVAVLRYRSVPKEQRK